MGRKKIPTKIHALKGTDRADRINPNEPEYDVADMSPTPIILADNYALEEWNRVAPGLTKTGVLTVTDVATLERYCKAHARWRRAEDEIMKPGNDVHTTPNGMKQQSVYVSMANSASTLSNKLAAELGITPASRSKVSATGKNGVKKADPWSKLG